MAEKKYSGYGYHGGGRPRKAESEKRIYKSVSICGTPEEIAALRAQAECAGLSVSRFVLRLLDIHR